MCSLRFASCAVQFHPDGGQFDFARSSARTPHVGPQYVWMSWRNQEKYPPDNYYRSFSRAGLARVGLAAHAAQLGRHPGVRACTKSCTRATLHEWVLD